MTEIDPRIMEELATPRPLGAVERGILLAAEREVHPASFWGGTSETRLVPFDQLVTILRRSSDLAVGDR
jgi:hypothetical protein